MSTEIHSAKTMPGASICIRLWALLLVLLGGCSSEEPKDIPQNELTIEYTIDRESIRVGDPVELQVTAYYPTNSVLELPELGRERDVVLLNRNWENIPRNDGLSQSETRYTLSSFRLGKHIISTNEITCRTDTNTFVTNFPTITLNVESTLPEDASSELADIKPIHKLSVRIPKWLWILPLTGLIAFVIGLAVAKLWKNRETLIPNAPAIPPHLIAFQALEALKNKGLLENDECNPFYTELSLILRTYLEGRFHLNAPEETTEEIVEEMSRSPELNGTQRNILQAFMRQADMVKFAKGHPDRATMEAAFDTTKKFVEETGNPTDPSDRSTLTNQDL